MRKTKLSFDLIRATAWQRRLICAFSTGTQGPPSSCKSRSQRRPSPRLSASASHHLPLYQDKAVTPTPLKDIFTPIWARPWLCELLRLCAFFFSSTLAHSQHPSRAREMIL